MIASEPCRRPDKRRHATAASARKHLAYLKRRSAWTGARADNLSVYRCGDHWHVGSWRTWGGGR